MLTILLFLTALFNPVYFEESPVDIAWEQCIRLSYTSEIPSEAYEDCTRIWEHMKDVIEQRPHLPWVCADNSVQAYEDGSTDVQLHCWAYLDTQGVDWIYVMGDWVYNWEPYPNGTWRFVPRVILRWDQS